VTIIPTPPDIQTVVIQFEGICVNFRRSDFPFLPAAHRIVLINASMITNVWGNSIAPHLAGFTLNSLDPDTPTTALSGAMVQITNPLQTGLVYDTTYNAIPSLTLLTLGLNGPSLAVLTGHNPDLTSCYFDINHGTISSAPSLGATMTVVTIQTLGPPMFQVTPFPTGLSSTPSPVLQPEAATNQMFFSNEEVNIADASDFDFLLSYLVVNLPPVGTPTLPPTSTGTPSPNRKSAMAAKLHMQQDFSDVGCSNSTYP